MQPHERREFLKVLAGVHDFYGKEMSDFAGQVWVQACEGFELAQATKALSAHLMDPDRGQFMPKPADLVRTLHGTQSDRSLIAWGKTLDAMRRVGAYTSVVFDDGVIHAVIEDLGGWVKACQTELDELPHLQRRFCESYKAYSRRGEVSFPPRLPGAHELENGLQGRHLAPPVLVGNPQRAQQVAQQGINAPKTQLTTVAQALRLADGASDADAA